MEGDAEMIIKTLIAWESLNPWYGHVIQDVLMLAIEFHSCFFSHVKRTGDTVAHFLARKAVSSNEL